MVSRGSFQAYRLCVDWPGLCLSGSFPSYHRDLVGPLSWSCIQCAINVFEENFSKGKVIVNDGICLNVVCLYVHVV